MDKFEWFKEAKFGMMIHWGLYCLPAGEWKGQRMDYIGEWLQSRYRIPNLTRNTIRLRRHSTRYCLMPTNGHSSPPTRA